MPSNSKHSQTTISSYFSQTPSPEKPVKRRERPVSPIDLTSDAEDKEEEDYADEPPIKKLKIVRLSQSQTRPSPSTKSKSKASSSGAGAYTQSTLFSRTTSTPPRQNFLRASQPSTAKMLAQASPSGMAEQWAFIPQASDPDSPRSEGPGSTPDRGGRTQIDPEKDAEKARRHEAFKKKLLEDDSRFRLRPGILGASGPISIDRERSSSPEEGYADSGDDSDTGFKEIMDLFSHTAPRGKGNGKAADKTGAATQRRGKTSGAVGRRTKKPPPKIGPSGEAYTPLELQVLDLKENNPGTLLMIEVGYRYKFFGDDAKVAAKELGMVAYNDRNFLVASIPTERLSVHLKKLLARGYRVGVVNQVETAALKKVSDNRNAPFDRKLTHLYTAATYVDDLDSADDLQSYSPPPLMCLIEEQGGGNTGDVSIGMITICPSTGDVVWDDFKDTLMRIELETRLVHVRPAELLIPGKELSEPTSKMLQHFTGTSAVGDRLRMENIKTQMSYTDAFSSVANFYADKKRIPAASDSIKSGKLMAEITGFPKRVVIALAHVVKYLSPFNIAEALLETKFFAKFTTRAHMLLAANTLTNLEIYQNETDHTVKGTLLEVLNKTRTKFGARLLKSWIGRPLVDKRVLQERVDAVEEILTSESGILMTLRDVLKRLPDLARGLCRIQYGQCTPKELAILLSALNKVAIAYDEYDSPSDVGFSSRILNEIIYSLPKLRRALQQLLGSINLKRAAEDRKDLMWTNPEKYPGIIDADLALQTIEVELSEELKTIRKKLRMPSLQWTSHLNDEYLIEVKKANSPPIPDSWIMHSRTTKLVRYQVPSVRSKAEAGARFREMLEAESQKAYQEFLKEISDNHYSIFRDAVNKLAAADCLLGLARVALEKNYVKPEFTDDDSLEILEGRHPMVEVFRDDPFVPNSITMGFGEPRNKIITGPNMGGKSSFVRMVALVVLMAQVGSYVPAQSVKMGLHDSILTRMGASDDLAKGRSTFMVEMSETSDILHTATSRSLVVLDELGRGTSTFDGMAIADAVLQQLAEHIKCKTLFITHYPLIASGIEQRYPKDVENIHMGYTSDARIDGTKNITFLYKLAPGITTESFGIECARLAGLPEPLLEMAVDHSQKLQHLTEKRIRQNRMRKAVRLFKQCQQEEGLHLESTLTELKSLIKSLSISGSTHV